MTELGGGGGVSRKVATQRGRIPARGCFSREQVDGWTNGTLIEAFAQAQLNFQLHYIQLLWEQSSPAVKSSGLIYPRSCKGGLLTYCSLVLDRVED